MTEREPNFGQSTPRVEDAELLTGRGRFVDDIVLPDMVAAAFVRSPYPHATIRSIDPSQALAIDGVFAVFTYADFRPHLASDRIPLALSSSEIAGITSKSMRADITPFVLVKDEVCYVGDPVAMVVAENRYIAEDAIAHVMVDYDPLDVVADCRTALEPDSPTVHRDTDSNLLAEFSIGYGDTEQAFSTAHTVCGLVLDQHRGCAHPIEGRGVVAHNDPFEDRTTVWSSTQSPHEIRMTLAWLLRLDDEQLRVVTPDVGGGFGAKYLTYPEEVAVTLSARLMGKPVKWIEDRREHFLAAIQERDQHWKVELALDADAKILGIRGAIIHDQGAYTPQGINVAYNAATAMPGPYRVPNYDLLVQTVETNKVPTMPVRGAGYPQGTYAMERLLDAAARTLSVDRTEIRRRNLITAEEMPYETPMRTRAGSPVKYDSGDFPRCMEAALGAIDYASFPQRQQAALQDGRYIGIGIANATKGTGRGPFETAVVRVGRSGRVSVYTGAAAMGQSTKTMMAQIVGDQFGLAVDKIHVVAGDTQYTSMGHGGFASRQAVNAGNSAHLSATTVREKALEIAAQVFGQPVDALEIDDGHISVKGGSNVSLGLGDLAREASGIPGYSLPKGIEPGLECTTNYMPEGLAYSFGSHAVEVEVDPGTGLVRILRYVIVSDCGRLINPIVVDGQIKGGAAHGIGNALFERMGYDENAQPVTTNFGEYLLPTAPELPEIELIHHETPSPLNPLGVKGVGEVGTIPVTAAIAAAVENALTPFSVEICETPISPSRLVELILTSRTADELRALRTEAPKSITSVR